MSVFFPETYHSAAGYPKKVEKHVKRKHHFWQFGAPLSHLRLFRLCFLPCRFLPYVSFPLKSKWFSKNSRSHLWFSFEETTYFHRFSLKSWSFLWKTDDLSRLSFICLIFLWTSNEFLKIQSRLRDSFRSAFQGSLKSLQNDPLVTVGSESAFAKKGYVLKMPLSERPPFSRNCGLQIWDL